MKVNANQIVRDDPWEDELEGCRFVACMAEDEGNLPNIQPQADNIRQDTWKNILKLREYFDKQLISINTGGENQKSCGLFRPNAYMKAS